MTQWPKPRPHSISIMCSLHSKCHDAQVLQWLYRGRKKLPVPPGATVAEKKALGAQHFAETMARTAAGHDYTA